jgi:hypothetical protein
MQLIYLYGFRTSATELAQLITTKDFYLNLIFGSVFLILSSKFLFSLIKIVWRNILTHRTIQSLIINKNKNYSLIKNNKYSHSFTAGVMGPNVYLSKEVEISCTEQELQAILQHEYYHCLQLDPLKSIIVNLAKTTLPFFPGKRQLIDSYEVLTELAADEYAEESLGARLPVVKALVKSLQLKQLNQLNQLNLLLVSDFALHNNRVEILTEQSAFTSRNFFMLLLGALVLTSTNLVLLANTNIFMQCQHIVECLRAVL